MHDDILRGLESKPLNALRHSAELAKRLSSDRYLEKFMPHTEQILRLYENPFGLDKRINYAFGYNPQIGSGLAEELESRLKQRDELYAQLPNSLAIPDFAASPVLNAPDFLSIINTPVIPVFNDAFSVLDRMDEIVHTYNIHEVAYIEISRDLLKNITSVLNRALTYIEDVRGLKHTESISIEDICTELTEDESSSGMASGPFGKIRAKLSCVPKFMKKMVGVLCTFSTIVGLPANIQNSAQFVSDVFSQEATEKYQYEQPEPENGDQDELPEAEMIVEDMTDALQQMNEQIKLSPGDEALKEQAKLVEDFIQKFKSTAISSGDKEGQDT